MTVFEPSIVVLSHLRWDFVYQRPQHLLSRLAQWRRVIFIEEPIFAPGVDARWELRAVADRVLSCRLHTPIDAPGFADAHMPVLLPAVQQLLDQQNAARDYVAWVYTPMALPILENLSPDVVVYDCMDALTHFRFAPPELVERERMLMSDADVVFTGGPSLYRARQGQHQNIHCFPSSVDSQHYASGMNNDEPADQADIPRPRLGFFGVIDERFDTDIVSRLAERHPEWQVVLLGPVVKIDPATLPDSPNVHLLGMKQYADLPKYLARWDLALLPFAQNEATKFISPTKTLEYMAADKLIVSTPITDVAEPYGHIVYLGDTPDAFVDACARALGAAPQEREQRLNLARAVIRNTNWDHTAASMKALVAEALARNTTYQPEEDSINATPAAPVSSVG